MPDIVCKGISLGYGGKVIAEDISFTVEEGDYLCIVGENGAGKSTLVKTLLGLESPIQGEVIVDSKISKNRIGYLPQQTELQRDFPATVWEIVLSGCGKSLFFGKKQKTIATENMKKLGIDNLKNRCYRELSGGQQQRVLLARALCAAKRLLLLDEPAAGLDPVATNEMYHLVMDLNKQEDITVVMVSHDIKAAVRHSKHILHLGDGEMFFGTAEEYSHSNVGIRFLNSDKCGRCGE